MLSLLAVLAHATTSESAFTKTNLASYGSDFSMVRTLSGTKVSAPDLCVDSNRIITTNLGTLGGAYDLEQGVYFFADSSQDNVDNCYSWSNVASLSVAGKQIIHLDSSITSSVEAAFQNFDNTKLDTTNYGLGMVSPGSNNYKFSVSGGHNTVSDAQLVSVPMWMIVDPKMFSISFKQYPLNIERPADSLNQNFRLDYDVINGDLAYYGYEFSRMLQVDGVTCDSMMSYSKGNGEGVA